MFTIEQLIEGEWVEISAHTQDVDADVQLQRFIASGISEDQLRKVAPSE